MNPLTLSLHQSEDDQEAEEMHKSQLLLELNRYRELQAQLQAKQQQLARLESSFHEVNP